MGDIIRELDVNGSGGMKEKWIILFIRAWITRFLDKDGDKVVHRFDTGTDKKT